MPLLAGLTTTDLLEPADLAGFAGAPFADEIVAVVGESIRSAAGWHIAPGVVETVAVEGDGTRYLLLPTLHLTDVTAVRDVSDPDNPRTLDGWSKARTPRFTAGCLRRSSPWPCVDIEVDIVHGYDGCPADLLAAAAALCQDARVNKATGKVRLGSLSLDGTGDEVAGEGTSTAAAIARYRLTAAP